MVTFKSEAMKLVYRRCERTDLDNIVTFHREACNADSTREFWQWKYFDNPAGDTFICVALDGKKIVGMIGEHPVRMLCFGQQMLGAQIQDVDILSNYRKGSTFYRLKCLAEKTSKDHGVLFDFGFAIELTLKISTRTLGFCKVSPVSKWVKILDPTAHLQRYIKSELLARIVGGMVKKSLDFAARIHRPDTLNIQPIEQFDSRFDAFWQSLDKPPITIIKDSKYMNWRYALCPATLYESFVLETSQGEIRGVIVLQYVKRDGIDYGYIADLLVDHSDHHATRSLLYFAIDRFRKKSMSAVVAWFPEAASVCSLIRRLGFKTRPVFHYFVSKSYVEEAISKKNLCEAKNWTYVFGDSDYLLAARKR